MHWHRYGDIIATGTEAKAIICLLILLGIITMGYFGSIFSDSVANKLQRQAVKRDKRIVAFLAGVGKARNTAIEKAMSKTGVFRYFLKRS